LDPAAQQDPMFLDLVSPPDPTLLGLALPANRTQ